MRRAHREGGQASVELVAMLPVAVAVLLATLQLLAAGVGRELAGNAAQAGAMALLRREDAEKAAVDALPGWSKGNVRVDVDGSRVVVRLRPRTLLPGLAGPLTATARADAGAA